MNLSDIELLQLIPAFMQTDETVIALATAIEPHIKAFVAQARLLSTWDQINTMTNAELDALAWELDAIWYSPKATIDTKRYLIKQTDLIHAKLGTKWAVEELIKAYFGDGTVEEWFDYGGEPYHFRIRTANASATEERAQEFMRNVYIAKNTRSWLDEIIVELIAKQYLYYAWIPDCADILTIRQVN